MADTSRLALNTATVTQQWSLQECISGCVRHSIAGIDPWRDKLQKMGVTEAAKSIKDNGLMVSGLCRGGMFTGPDAKARSAALDDNRRAVDEAAEIGADCLVLVVGGIPGGSRDIASAREQVRDGIGALLDHSRASNVPLAIEPLHPMYAGDRACVNTLGQANDLCDELGDGVGVAIDVYHVWWDPNLENEIKRCGQRILGFHVCDWLVPTRDLLLDRGMMGDGVINIPQILGWVEKAGYRGLIEVEIFSSKKWWREDADEVLQTVRDRFEKFV